MGNMAETRRRHFWRSLASFCTSPQVRPISWSSAWTVLCQVVFGHQGLRFPTGVHCIDFFEIRPCSILKTWLSHFRWRCLILCKILVQPVLRYRSSLHTFWGQKMRHVFHRQSLWSYPCLPSQYASTHTRKGSQILHCCCIVSAWSSGYSAWISRWVEALQRHLTPYLA